MFRDEYQLPLSEQERNLRLDFVKEYLKDFDRVAAAMRLGFLKQFAEKYSKEFMAEPYVQYLISSISLKEPDDIEAQEEADRQLVLKTLRETAQNGPPSSRVTAAGRLAAILGMDAPVKTQTTVNQGGVMVVPGIASVTDWEASATSSQDALVRNSRDV